MYQVAQDLLPVCGPTLWPLPFPLPLLHGHQEDAMAQEGHVIDRHVPEVVGHQEHLHHRFVGVE